MRRDLERAAAGCSNASTHCSTRARSAASEPNVADYQIATSVRLLQTLDDLGPLIEAHPAIAAHAERVVPHYPGHTPPVFPREWLPSRRFAREPATAG